MSAVQIIVLTSVGMYFAIGFVLFIALRFRKKLYQDKILDDALMSLIWPIPVYIFLHLLINILSGRRS